MAAGVRIGLQEVQESERVRERVCVCVFQSSPLANRKVKKRKQGGQRKRAGEGTNAKAVERVKLKVKALVAHVFGPGDCLRDRDVRDI